jgi:hypothetical protein
LAPLGESGGTVQLEIISAVARALLVEMDADGGMNGDEFLQTSHPAEPLHGSLSPSKRLVRILSPVVQPTAGFLSVSIVTLIRRSVVSD